MGGCAGFDGAGALRKRDGEQAFVAERGSVDCGGFNAAAGREPHGNEPFDPVFAQEEVEDGFAAGSESREGGVAVFAAGAFVDGRAVDVEVGVEGGAPCVLDAVAGMLTEVGGFRRVPVLRIDDERPGGAGAIGFVVDRGDDDFGPSI